MKAPRVSKIGIIVLLALIGVASVPIYLIVSNAVQGTSVTCYRCHPEPYDSWRASEEHPMTVSCQECHTEHTSVLSFPPSFSAKYSQMDPYCLDCHRDVREKVAVDRKLIKVSHKRHLDEGLACLDCHRYVAHGVGGFQSNRPPKKACYRCHIREIDGSAEDRSCRMCHYILLTTATKAP